MSRPLGNVEFPNNFECGRQGPLDARLVTPLRVQLSNGSIPQTYNGMVVAVISDPVNDNNGLYLCESNDGANANDWVKVGSSSFSGNYGDLTGAPSLATDLQHNISHIIVPSDPLVISPPSKLALVSDVIRYETTTANIILNSASLGFTTHPYEAELLSLTLLTPYISLRQPDTSTVYTATLAGIENTSDWLGTEDYIIRLKIVPGSLVSSFPVHANTQTILWVSSSALPPINHTPHLVNDSLWQLTFNLSQYIPRSDGSFGLMQSFSGNYDDLTGAPSLATVATSGNYGDLTGAPSLATVATSGNYGDLTGAPSLATVATSGNYNDLSNKPSIPSPISSTNRLNANLVANGTISNAEFQYLNGVSSNIQTQMDSKLTVGDVDLTHLKPMATVAKNMHLQGTDPDGNTVLLMGTETLNNRSVVLKYFQGDDLNTGRLTVNHWGDAAERGLNVIQGGNIGINNATPEYTLDVSGNINFTGNLTKNGADYSGGSGGGFSVNSSDHLQTDKAEVHITGTNPSLRLGNVSGTFDTARPQLRLHATDGGAYIDFRNDASPDKLVFRSGTGNNSHVTRMTIEDNTVKVFNNIEVRGSGAHNVTITDRSVTKFDNAPLTIGCLLRQATLFISGNVEKMRIMPDDGNNVVLSGTAPDLLFEATVDGATQNDVNMGTITFKNSFRAGNGNGNAAQIKCQNIGDDYDDDGSLLFFTGGGGNDATLKMVIEADGNVGIGVNNPSHKLDVAGDINLTGKLRLNGSIFPTTIDTEMSTTSTNLVTNAAITTEINNNNSGIARHIIFATEDVNTRTCTANKVVVNAENALQGNGSKNASLYVEKGLLLIDSGTGNGYTNANGVVQINTRQAGKMTDGMAIRMWNNNNHIINFQNSNNQNRGKIKGNGSNSVQYFTNSDRRLKTNIQNANSCWDMIKTLQPRTFTWIDDNRDDMGFIAQEVHQAIPLLKPTLDSYSTYCDASCCTVDETGYCENPVTETGEIYSHSLDYGQFTPYLWKALQEAIARIETLELKIQALEG